MRRPQPTRPDTLRPSRYAAKPRRAGAGGLALAACLVLSIAATASADEPDGASARSNQYYLGVYAAGSWATADMTRTGFPDASGDDQSFFFGANLGLERHLGGPLRIRLELDGTNERRFTVAFPGGGAGDEVELEAWTMSGNFWIVYPLADVFPNTPIIRRISPFGGGGVGFSRMTIEVNAAGFDTNYQKARFAWLGGVGATIEITDWLSLDARYQYTDFGRGTATIVNGGGTPQGELGVDLSANEFLGGVRFVY